MWPLKGPLYFFSVTNTEEFVPFAGGSLEALELMVPPSLPKSSPAPAASHNQGDGTLEKFEGFESFAFLTDFVAHLEQVVSSMFRDKLIIILLIFFHF